MSCFWLLAILLQAPSGAVAVQWRCVEFACSVWNWNPFQEDSFSLNRRSGETNFMTFVNLKILSLSMALLDQKGMLEGYTTIKSSPVHSIYLPSRTKISALVLEQTYISNITFEANNTYLAKLYVANSRLKDVPGTVINLAGIKYISITMSRIHSVDFSLFAKLQHLENLDLNYNIIKHLDCSTSSNEDFPNLKELYLSYNRLITVNLQHFNTMNALESLYLSNNQIIHLEGPLVMHNLKFLDIAQNAISTLCCCNWTVGNLKNLDMYNNKLELLPTCIEETMANLSILHLSSNALSDSNIFSKLASMRYLQILDISYNKFTSLAFNNMFPSLTYLNLESNRLTDISVPVANDGLTINVNCNLIEQFDPENVSCNVASFHMHCNPIDCSWDKRFKTEQKISGKESQCVVTKDDECNHCHI